MSPNITGLAVGDEVSTMLVAAVITARAVRLLDARELNPYGKDLAPLVVGLTRRYHFRSSPKIDDQLHEGGLKFSDGVFVTPNQERVAVDLEVYLDGLVATTRSNTSHADAMIDDVLTWANSTFGIGNQEQILNAKRTYRSELVVYAPDVSIASACEKLRAVATALNLGDDDVIGFSIGSKNRDGVAAFTFERKKGTPFDEHKYYTNATLETDRHTQILRELEKVLRITEKVTL
jgi:hypothetical protein